MPVFDNEISANIPEQSSLPKAPLGSPQIEDLNTSMGGFEGFGSNTPVKTGLGLDDLSKIQVGNTATFDSPFQMVPRSELLANKRYALYERGKDLENIYGLKQSAWAQLGNGVAKMVTTAAGTFAEGFATIPDTVSAIRNKDWSKLAGDPDGYEGSIDTWMRNMEDKFPNYYTRHEKEHPWLATIPGFSGSANFWGNMMVKNAGFMVGAIGSAIVQDAVIGMATQGAGAVPLVSAQVGKAALWLNKIMTRTSKLDKVLDAAKTLGAAEKTMLNLTKLGEIAKGSMMLEKAATGIRYGLNIYGSARTEAGVEARDGYRQIKESLIEGYKLQNLGAEPTPEALQEIDKYATDAMNARFAINMALLTVSNAIQFDTLFKSFGKMKEGLASTVTKKIEKAGKIGLKEGSLDVFEKKIPEGFVANAWDIVKPTIPNIFSEGIYEEGGQYAAERGTYDYYTRKYKNKDNQKNWDTLNETLRSTGYGLMEQFGSDEGMQNMFVGALTGTITGGIINRIDAMKKHGANERLQASLDILNKYGLTGILSEKYENTLNSVSIAKEMAEAAKNNDMFKYKNLKHDQFFTFVMSRIPSGMHDVTVEQLELLKELKEEDFQKTFGMSFDESNKKTVREYVDVLINKANSIKDTVTALDNTFRNPFKLTINPKTDAEKEANNNYKTFNDWKIDMAYYSSIAPDLNSRLESMNQDLSKINPLLNTDNISQFTDPESLKTLAKAYEEKANQLSQSIENAPPSIQRNKIKQEIANLRSMSERVNMLFKNGEPDLKSFGKLLNFELNNQEFGKTDVIGAELLLPLFMYSFDINRNQKLKKDVAKILDTLTDKNGFDKYFKQGKYIQEQKEPEVKEKEEEAPAEEPKAPTFINKEGVEEEPELDREYESPTVAHAKVRKVAEDRFSVKNPDGSIDYYDTREKANAAAAEKNANINDLAKVRVVDVNDDGTVKVEDLAGNIQNLSLDKLKGYVKIESEEEKISKDSDSLKKQQDELQKDSDPIPNEPIPTGEEPKSTEESDEGKLKAANIFFISSIGEFEDAKSGEAKPHVKRSRIFLNYAKYNRNRADLRAILVTAKNAAALGLDGIVQLSYEVSGDTPTSGITNEANEDTKFIAQVFTMLKPDGKLYFVDQKGDVIKDAEGNDVEVGKKVDLNQVVFATMPTAEEYYQKTDQNGNQIARWRKHEHEEFLAQLAGYKLFRKALFDIPVDQMPKGYEFDISRGLPRMDKVNGVDERNHVGKVLINEAAIKKSPHIITMSLSGAITHEGRNIPVPKGVPMFQFGDTLVFLNNTKFSQKRATDVYQVLKAFAQDIIDQRARGGKISLNAKYYKFLRSVLYWREGTTGLKPNQIFMVLGKGKASISLGGIEYPLTQIANSEQQIVGQLVDAFQNINNKQLTSHANEPFDDFITIDGKLESIKWDNYQLYLVASKYPNGSERSVDDTPLITNVNKPTKEKPYSFIQKYSTLKGIDIPVQKVPEKQSTPTDKINTDGKTENVYALSPTVSVKYLATKDENGLYVVEDVISDDVVKSIVPSKIDVATEFMKSDERGMLTLQEYESKLTGAELDEAIMRYFIASFIARNINPIVEKKKEAPEEKTEEDKKDINLGGSKNSIDDDTPFRRVGTSEKGKSTMTETEVQFFRDYMKQVAPLLPYEVIENLIDTFDGEKAWGVFENGLIRFYKGAIKGTEYHELGEAIWKSFLNEEQQRAILDEFKGRTGTFLDRQTNTRIAYSEATDLQAKERIMDDFADYRLGKLPAKTLGEKILKFFRAIIEFFKSFGRNEKLKYQLFKAIDAGKFKEMKVPESVKANGPEYRRIPRVSEKTAYEVVQDMSFLAVNYIFRDDKAALFNPDKVTGLNIYQKISDRYIDAEKYDPTGADPNKLNKEAFDMLFDRMTDFMYTLGITIADEEVVDINEADTTNLGYAPEPFSTDWKKAASFVIKFITATLPVTLPSNQQINDGRAPALQKSDSNGALLNDFSRVFATLLGKLCNTSNVYKFAQKMYQLAKDDPNYVRLYARMGGDIRKGKVPFDNFSSTDWKLFINMYQTFTKQKPNTWVQYETGNEIYTASADQFTTSKGVERQWFENMKSLSNDPSSIIVRVGKEFRVKPIKANIREINPHTFRVVDFNKKEHTFDTLEKAKEAADSFSFPVRTPADSIIFLKALGIDFPMEHYALLKTTKEKGQHKSDRDQFLEAVASIRSYLERADVVGSLSGKTLGINQHLATLSRLQVKITNPNQENTHPNLSGTRSQSYAEDNLPSIFENEFNDANTLENLLIERPELNDIFAKHSVILTPGGLFVSEDGRIIRDMKVAYIEGKNDLDKDKGTSITKSSLGDKLSIQINQNLNGNYYILVPGDGSTEWMLNLGNHVSFMDIVSGDAAAKVHEIFKGYLLDDIAVALDYVNRRNVNSVADRGAKELRFFKDILDSDTLEVFNKLIASDATEEDFKAAIEKHSSAINAAVDKFIEEKTKKQIEALKDSREVVYKTEDTYAFDSLQDNFALNNNAEKLDKFNLSEKQLKDLMTYVNTNYIINNIELHKILFGDPYQFAIKDGQLEETKRIKSALSPRRKTFDIPEFNRFLNRERNMVGDIELSAPSDTSFGDPGYHEYKDHAKTVTLADVNLANEIYDRINETDAASAMMDNAWREVKEKNGQWTEEAEEWHQWQMAWTRLNMPGYVYRNEALKKHDQELIETEEPEFSTEILKPIVFGSKLGQNKINIVLDKFSQMPLYYKAIKGTNLGKLYEKMWKEGIDYVVFESGRKVGIEEKYKLYNEKGELNEAPFTNIIDVPWKIYGIQVENLHKDEKTQTRGSQETKVNTMDMFENGIAVHPEIAELFKKYKDNLDQLHEHAVHMFFERTGIVDDGINGYSLKDPIALASTLSAELRRRQLSENAKDTVEIPEGSDQFAIPFEASPVYKQINDVLYSMIHKSIISPTMNGAPHVQAPVTMWENAGKGRGLVEKTAEGFKKITKEKYDSLPEERRKKVYLTDDTLKFYEDKTDRRYCEVMLPHWFKEKMLRSKKFKNEEELINYLNNSPDGKEILTGIGFRIPTQGMSSIEVFRVKAFLPKSMGYTIIVPSAITSKAGSDFDIDKLNTYLKNVYVDDKGDIRLVRYQGSEAATRAFFDNMYTQTISRKIDAITNTEKFRNTLSTVLEKMGDRPAYSMKGILTKEEYEFYDKHLDTIYAIIGQAEETGVTPYEYISTQIKNLLDQRGKLTLKLLNDKLRKDYINSMYKASLENEHFKLIEQLVTRPENFKQLTTPVDDTKIKAEAKTIADLRGEPNEADIKNRLLDIVYMTELRHAFTLSKIWVGIAAVNITGHANAQKTQLFIDPSKRLALDNATLSILGDLSIALPHNKVNINGVEYTSMSGIYTADKSERISDRLSRDTTAIVDAVKNPYITKIVSSTLAINTYMFLERIGAGKTAGLFINQPIIREYLKYLDAKGSSFLFNGEDVNAIKKMFPTTKTDFMYAKIDPNALATNIQQYYKDGKFTSKKAEGAKSQNNINNAVQQVILDEFLKYAKMADFSSELNQATNYDTTKFKNSESVSRKQTKTSLARTTNIFSSPDDLMNSNFIGRQSELLDVLIDSMGAIMKLDQRDFRDIVRDVMRPYEEMKFLGKEDFERIAAKVKATFLDYIIQLNTDLTANIPRLTLGEDSVANRILRARESYPGLKILSELEVESNDRENSPKTVKLRVKPKEALDENRYVEMMRELRDVDLPLYKDLIKLIMLQGSANTAISLKSIIPLEDYAAEVKPIIDKVKVTKELILFTKGLFQKTNWKEDIIVPTFAPTFSPNVPVGEEHLPIGQFGDVDIFQYVSRMFPKTSFGESTSRKILTLSPTYNARYTGYEVVKIPRIVKTKTGEMVDLISGKTLAPGMYAERKKKGDLTLKDVYGYQKVKYPNGEPVKTSDGRIVYKQINLLGDGQYLTEIYNDGRKSVVDNGTYQVDEINDDDIIREFSPATIVAEPSPEKEGAAGAATALEMQPKNIEKIKQGTKTVTNRTKLFNNGIYDLPDGTKVVLTYIGKFNLKIASDVNQLGLQLGLNPSTPGEMTTSNILKTLAIAEGFKDWQDFVKNNYMSQNFVAGRQSRYVYNVRIAEENEINMVSTPMSDIQRLELEINALQQQLKERLEIEKHAGETSFERVVLNNLPKITPESAMKETGTRAGIKQDINSNLLSKEGLTVDDAAHAIWENHFFDTNIDTGDIRNVIIDILNAGSKKSYEEQFGGSRDVQRLKSEIQSKQEELKAEQAKIQPKQLSLFDQSLQPVKVDRLIPVHHMKITVKVDGSMFHENGTPVIDQTTRNKVNIRMELQDGSLRTSEYNGSNYFVLSDDRIVGSGATNLGKETVTDATIRAKILAKATLYKSKCD